MRASGFCVRHYWSTKHFKDASKGNWYHRRHINKFVILTKVGAPVAMFGFSFVTTFFCVIRVTGKQVTSRKLFVGETVLRGITLPSPVTSRNFILFRCKCHIGSKHTTTGKQWCLCKADTYGLLTKCEVKMAAYWPSSFFACLWTETKSRSINTQKKNLANMQPSWPHTWSITHTYLYSRGPVRQVSCHCGPIS